MSLEGAADECHILEFGKEHFKQRYPGVPSETECEVGCDRKRRGRHRRSGTHGAETSCERRSGCEENEESDETGY